MIIVIYIVLRQIFVQNSTVFPIFDFLKLT